MAGGSMALATNTTGKSMVAGVGCFAKAVEWCVASPLVFVLKPFGRVIAAETLPRKPTSVDEGGGNQIVSAQINGSKIDIDRIRNAMKTRRRDKDVNKNVHAVDDEIDPEAWIENELGNGVELKKYVRKEESKVVSCFMPLQASSFVYDTNT